jgi:ribosomal protein L31
MNVEKNELFIIHEFMSLSIMAGLATRNANSPIYEKNTTGENRDEFKKAIRTYLFELYKEVKGKQLNDIEKVYEYWSDFELVMTQNYSQYLHDKKFRIGISQKIISLFLKFLYCSGKIKSLCICPIDGIVKEEILNEISKGKIEKVELKNWTEITEIEDLQKYVMVLQSISNSVIDWEIDIWNKKSHTWYTDQKVVERGGKNIDNFEQFMKDFEESRQDRILPFRD